MTNVQRLLLAGSAIFAAACGRAAAMDDGMKEDLQAASAATMELAPVGGGQKVVSAIEQTGRTQPRVTTSRKAVAPARTPRPETRQETQTASKTPAEPAATVPVNRPAVNPPPPGGYKTIGEVLRNAPFPIKP